MKKTLPKRKMIRYCLSDIAKGLFNGMIGNYLLIGGKFGFPALGIMGAALATVISRYVELAIVVVWTHCNSDKHPFIKGAFRSFHIPGRLLGRMAVKGTPLLFNEFLWAFGLTFLII